jgi:hypothetical protein
VDKNETDEGEFLNSPSPVEHYLLNITRNLLKLVTVKGAGWERRVKTIR